MRQPCNQGSHATTPCTQGQQAAPPCFCVVFVLCGWLESRRVRASGACGVLLGPAPGAFFAHALAPATNLCGRVVQKRLPCRAVCPVP